MSLTFAIGDIHGALHKLRDLVARCEAYPGGDAATYVFVGDYIDRGPDVRGVLELVIGLAATAATVVTLRGNHESMLLATLDGVAPAEHWLGQGGRETLQSYGIADPRDLPQQHVDWLRALRTTYDDGRRFFVHAGIDPRRPLDAQQEEDLLWIREPFLSDTRDYGRLIVHGHTPLRDGVVELRANRLNLDTAAVYGGRLTAAVFSNAVTAPLGFLQVA